MATTGAVREFREAMPIRFPLYLMKGEVIEIEGKFYTIPEPVACNTPKELCVFLYEKGVKPH